MHFPWQDEGVISLCSKITAGEIEGISHLNVAANGIGKEGCKALADLITQDKGTLRFLDVSGNEFDDSMHKKLWKAVKEGEKSCLGHIADDNYELKVGCTSLQIIAGQTKRHADENYVVSMPTQEVALFSLVLRRNQELLKLTISCGLDDKAGAWIIDAFRANRTLKEVDLSDNQFGIKTAEAFRRNFNDHDEKNLNSGNKSIVTFALRSCGLDDTAAVQFAKGLKATKNESLEVLDLRKNELAEIKPFQDVLESRPRLCKRLTVKVSGNSGINFVVARKLETYVSSKPIPTGQGSASSSSSSSSSGS